MVFHLMVWWVRETPLLRRILKNKCKRIEEITLSYSPDWLASHKFMCFEWNKYSDKVHLDCTMSLMCFIQFQRKSSVSTHSRAVHDKKVVGSCQINYFSLFQVWQLLHWKIWKTKVGNCYSNLSIIDKDHVYSLNAIHIILLFSNFTFHHNNVSSVWWGYS